ncbi:phage tail protein [uncultured Chryseobacterium sp.]|uniref:phage tail protein n=1 Tax=uncultured Chryseobacterium sp. TaxID=259322 RepID=UPI0025FFD39D|nr:phage tail protein [uncultured Chryseobacterium sp.]
MKKIALLTLLPLSAVLYSQVGINNNLPKVTLDITAKTTDGSKPEGIIAPRLTGDQIKSADAQYGSDQRGAIVYALAAVSTASTKTANIAGEGYYFFGGNIWQRIGFGSDTSIYNGSGSLSGNTIVAQNANTLSFTGTAVNAFSADGNTLSVDAANHRIGIGTAAPSVALEINNGSTAGAIKIADGTQALNKVLTSDGSGTANWQYSAMPPGAVIYTASGTILNGFLECNGAAVSRTTYSVLFSLIGTTYGSGDGSTTFNLPDLRGEFVRSWDHGRGVDSGRNLGSLQNHMLQNHEHDIPTPTGGTGSGRAAHSDDNGTNQGGNNVLVAGQYYTYSTGPSGNYGPETRPRNVGLTAMIRY